MNMDNVKEAKFQLRALILAWFYEGKSSVGKMAIAEYPSSLINRAADKFIEQFKAEQKQSAGVFPLPSSWIVEFKTAWFKDNDIGLLPKEKIKEMWQETERVCNMIYKYQRKEFEKQTPLKQTV